MNTGLIITTIVTVVLTLLGYLITYANNVRLAQRTERLNRVNKQLGEFYGPLFALIYSSDASWRAFRQKYRPHQGYFGDDKQPTDQELERWRLWMTTVFMPSNLRVYELIVSKADLLIESDMPKCLLDACAHVAAYQAVLKKWEKQDYSEYNSLLDFPSEVLPYCRQSFQKLKAEQAKLIGKKAQIPSTTEDGMLMLLSFQELQILAFFIQGLGPSEIAQKLNIHHSTANRALPRLAHKIGFKSMREMIETLQVAKEKEEQKTL